MSRKTCRDGKMRAPETYRVLTPLGIMLIECCEFGLHKLYQSEDTTDQRQPTKQPVEVLSAVPKKDMIRKHFEECVQWLTVYFANLSDVDDCCLPALCTVSEDGPFQDRVLFTLARNVHSGHTVTYAELATMAGSPGAQQSVGSAMAKNPFQLIVPCHRVIKSGQKVGAYSRGKRNSVKVWLLRHEGLIINGDTVSSTL